MSTCSACGSEEFHPLCNAIAAVMTLHSERVYQPTRGEGGYSWSVCGECGQAWPCETRKVLDAELSRKPEEVF